MNSNLLPQQKLSVLMVDDHSMIREAYKRILKTIEFVGEVELANSGEQAIEILKQTNFDIVLMDNSMPCGMLGVDATLWITQYQPKVKVIGISNIDLLDTGLEFMIKGAKGFYEKGKANELLEAALLAVSSGGTYFSEEIQTELIKHESGMGNFKKVELNNRELFIIECLFQAMNSKEIADKLALRQRRVEQLINEIHLKTGCKTQFQLAIFLARSKILK